MVYTDTQMQPFQQQSIVKPLAMYGLFTYVIPVFLFTQAQHLDDHKATYLGFGVLLGLVYIIAGIVAGSIVTWAFWKRKSVVVHVTLLSIISYISVYAYSQLFVDRPATAGLTQYRLFVIFGLALIIAVSYWLHCRSTKANMSIIVFLASVIFLLGPPIALLIKSINDHNYSKSVLHDSLTRGYKIYLPSASGSDHFVSYITTAVGFNDSVGINFSGVEISTKDTTAPSSNTIVREIYEEPVPKKPVTADTCGKEYGAILKYGMTNIVCSLIETSKESSIYMISFMSSEEQPALIHKYFAIRGKTVIYLTSDTITSHFSTYGNRPTDQLNDQQRIVAYLHAMVPASQATVRTLQQ